MDEEPDARKMSNGSKAHGQDVCALNAPVLATVPT